MESSDDSEGISIFQSVLYRILETLAPSVFQVIMSFDEDMQRYQDKKNPQPVSYAMSKIEEVFQTFPRKIPIYKSVIDSLKEIAKLNHVSVLHYLSKLVKDLLNQSTSTPFYSMQSLSPVFDQNNQVSKLMFYYFSLIFITDLICKIVEAYKCKQSIAFLTRAGYNFAISKPYILEIHLKIVSQWSVIFSLLSEIDFHGVSQIFSLFNSSQDLTIAFNLFKYLRLDADDALGTIFMDNAIINLTQIYRKKTLTNSILKAFSSLVVTLPFSEDLLNKLYSFAFQFRNNNNSLWGGAIALLSVLIPRIPKYISKMTHFIKKRILSQITDEKRLPDLLASFRLFMYGRNIDPNWYYWEWGKNSRCSSLVYIQWNSMIEVTQSDPKSFSSLFMNHFFPLANFYLCPTQFRSIIVHLASLDFNNFINSIVPKFLAVDTDDYRLTVLLMCVPIINSKDFAIYSYSKVTEKDIQVFNQKIKPKVFSSLFCLYDKWKRIKGTSHAVCVREHDLFVKSLTEESDQNIAEILDGWKIDSYKPMMVKLRQSEQCRGSYDLLTRLTLTLKFVLTPEDYSNKDVAELILKLASNLNNTVANESFELCIKVAKDLPDPRDFIKFLLESTPKQPDAESIFSLLLMLGIIIHDMPKEIIIDEEMLGDIQFLGFLCLSSIYPDTRHVAFFILSEANKRMNNTGLFQYLIEHKHQLEKVARNKIFLREIPKSPQTPNFPANTIKITDALFCHYYDIWVFFLAEIINYLISINYTIFLKRVEKLRSHSLSAILETNSEKKCIWDKGFIIIHLSTMFHLSTYLIFNKYELPPPYEEFDPEPPDLRAQFANILSAMISSKNPAVTKLAFTSAPHLHISLLPSVMEVMSTVPEDQIPNAVRLMAIILQNPQMTYALIHYNLRKIISFLTIFHLYCVKKGINKSRVIENIKHYEKVFIAHSEMIINYCLIIICAFKTKKGKPFSENELAFTTREAIFIYLANLIQTTSEQLQGVRSYSEAAFWILTSTGKIFQQVTLFEKKAINFFTSVNNHGFPVVENLMKYQFDILLDTYLNACYTEPFSVAEFYLTGIIDNIEDQDPHYILLNSGDLIMLCLIYKQREHPRAQLLIEKFLQVIESSDVFPETEEESSGQHLIKIIPEYFSYAVEAVFESMFRLIQLPNRRISIKDIVEAARPWIKVIRLLPKQKTCAQAVTSEFNYFTPYQFMHQLMITTESVSEDDFLPISLLWTELMKNPDHKQLIPCFIRTWKNNDTKQRLWGVLLETSPSDSVQMISSFCSFAYYYHITEVLSQDIENEFWFSKLLISCYHRHWHVIAGESCQVVQFGILFHDEGAPEILEVLCHQLKIECPEGKIKFDNMKDIVSEIHEKMKDITPDFTKAWGNEALKWVLGSRSVKFAALSLMVYNQINEPFEEQLLNEIIRVVYYHLDHCTEDIDCLIHLVSQSFALLKEHYDGHEDLAYNFVSSFLDCRVFFENAFTGTGYYDIFHKYTKFKPEKGNIISMIRPALLYMHQNPEIQGFVNYLVETTQSEELMMIVAPFKKVNPQLYPACMPVDVLLKSASETSMCQALSHYSFIMDRVNPFVLNTIFEISSYIVEQVVNENNRIALFKLYTRALHSIMRCNKALVFIRTIATREPKVSGMKAYDIYEWDRNLEDVCRSVKRLIVPDTSPSATITDCHNYTNVYGFLFKEYSPKILPYFTFIEMIDTMSMLQLTTRPKKTRTPDDSMKAMENCIKNSYSEVFHEINRCEIGLTPLFHPTKIILDENEFHLDVPTGLLSPRDYITMGRRSSSMMFNYSSEDFYSSLSA